MSKLSGPLDSNFRKSIFSDRKKLPEPYLSDDSDDQSADLDSVSDERGDFAPNYTVYAQNY